MKLGYKCKICGKVFLSRKEARKHIMKEHKAEWKSTGLYGTWIGRKGLTHFIEIVNIDNTKEEGKEQVKVEGFLEKLKSLFKK